MESNDMFSAIRQTPCKIGLILTLSAISSMFAFDISDAYSQSTARSSGAVQRGVAKASPQASREPVKVAATKPQSPAQSNVPPQTQRRAASASEIPQATENVQEDDAVRLTPEQEAKYKEALVLFNKQDFSGSLAALNDLYASNPAARPPRLIIARWFAELKNPQAVKLSLEQATAETPEDPEAYYSLAEFAIREGSFTAAELLAKQGDAKLAQYTANAKRVKNLARTSKLVKLSYSNARQRWNDSLEAVTALIKMDGETPDLYIAYANILFQQKQDDKARQALQRAEKLANGEGLPTDAAMAQLYATRGDRENAKACLDAALKANPKSSKVLILSISNALSENDLDAAWNLVQRLYKEDKSAEVLKTYGKVALFRSDFKSAEAAFQEAVRQNPLDTDASGGLALALCEQNDPDKSKRALQYAASNVQKQSNNRDFLATLGWTLYKAGQTDEAIKVLQQSIADGQINAASAYYFSVILNEKGQTDVARQLLTAAVSTTPPFAKRAEAEKLLAQINAQTPKSDAQPATQTTTQPATQK